MIRGTLLALVFVVAGCGAPAVRRTEATLAVTCDADAALYVDDEAAGRAADSQAHPVGLRAGFHRVELRADGKLTAYREVTLARGEHRKLSVELRPDLDQAP